MAGLEELRRSGPLVLAFCPEITEIAVETSGADWKLSRDSQEEGGLLTIRYVGGPAGEVSRFVAVAGAEGECCAALQLRPGESGLEVDQAQETAAKLFVLFPLIGSERLGLPATVNSRRFKPREDRDGIVAGDSSGAQENRRLLEDSVRHQEQLFEWCAQKKWAGAERMLAFDTAHLPDWAGSAPWFRPLLTELVRKARETPLMRTLGGEWIEPQAAWLPATDDPSHRERLWTLMSSWEGAQARLPRLDDLASWSRNLSGWHSLLGRSHEDMDEALTITKVARLVGGRGQRGRTAGATGERARACPGSCRCSNLHGTPAKPDSSTGTTCYRRRAAGCAAALTFAATRESPKTLKDIAGGVRAGGPRRTARQGRRAGRTGGASRVGTGAGTARQGLGAR